MKPHMHFTINSEARKIESKEEKLKEHKKYYGSLLQTRLLENLQEEKMEHEKTKNLKKTLMMNLKLKEKNNTAGGENNNSQNEKY